MSMRGARDLILLICAVISTQVWRVYLVRATAGHGIIWMVQVLRMDRRDPTAWLGMQDSNSETSSQIIPLKGRTDLRESSRNWRQRLFAFELRGWGGVARA
jgi:hypothetical protein